MFHVAILSAGPERKSPFSLRPAQDERSGFELPEDYTFVLRLSEHGRIFSQDHRFSGNLACYLP